MYRCITKVKGIVVDLDSFVDEDFEKWSEIFKIYKTLFLTSDENTENVISKMYGEQFVYRIYGHLKVFGPSPIIHKKALNTLHIQTTEMVYISRKLQFLQRAMGFCSGTIWIKNDLKYEDISKSPDIICPQFSYLKKFLEYGNFLGESVVSPHGDREHGIIIPVHFLVEKREVSLFVLGRYFGYTHYMHQNHPYSSAIYLNKQEGKKYYGVYNSVFLKLYLTGVCYIQKQIHVDYICAVPSHIGQKNRFKTIIEEISQKCNLENLNETFQCTHEYPKQKEATSYIERQFNILGVFSCDNDLAGKTVIIIDDVVTTGATLRECCKVLYEAGAKRVLALVLGVNQLPINYWSSDEPIVACPSCGSKMHLLINSKTKTFFYSCYQCGENLNYENGWEMFCNKINSEQFYTIDER